MPQELKVCGRTDCTYPYAWVLLYKDDKQGIWGALGICLDHYQTAKNTYNVLEEYEAKLFWSEKRWAGFLDKETRRLERQDV